MKKLNSLLTGIPFYLLLLSFYPVLFLWMTNFTQVRAYVVPRSLYISLGIAIFTFLSTWLIIHPARRAGLAAGWILILFYSYGQFFALVDNASVFGFVFGRHRFMLPLWGLIALGGIILILRSKSDLRKVTRVANIVFLLMMGVLLLQIGIKAVSLTPMVNASTGQNQAIVPSTGSSSTQRDVYYILLDGYGRSDLLKKDLNLDNQGFIESLKDIGFVIPRCGQSNYIDTAYSMAATLNMNYLDSLGFNYQELATGDHEKMLTSVITDSLVRQKFASMGYKFITYKTPYMFIDMPDSDVYMDVDSAVDPGEKIESLNFQQLFINTTLARTMVEWLEENPEDSKKMPVLLVRLVNPGSLNPDSSTFVGRNYKQYRENLFQLDSLETIPDIRGNKFVYAHLLVTHQPFTFRPNGELRLSEKDSYSAYADQIAYVNKRILEIVNTIKKKSSLPPVIILQSDHSFSDGGKRAQNLQAYYFPDRTDVSIPESFTNVNTFRLVFDTYFYENLPLLPDESLQIGANFENYVKPIPPTCPE